jgi:HSP20 family protein
VGKLDGGKTMFFTEPTGLGWNPLAEVQRLRAQIDQLFDDSWGTPRYRTPSEAWAAPASINYPAVNLWLGDDSVVVTAELPGLNTNDVDLTIRENTLTIHGERKTPEAENADWHRQERVAGEFTRTITLPFRVDPDRVDARFANGVLQVEMQRPEADKPHKIKINGK